ncbi:unnamed protein product [Rhizophagus irregularis]|uniref:DNA-directed DNA polymerase n=1 Tax=Rhizophagus irregularis TaxID=588596 RepID=A0A916A166_9GLOM|nr:unnamed protein product [Rhizophagus irregularis]
MSHDLYRGSDALERFVTKIEEKLANIQEDLSVPAEMIIAPGDLKAYNEVTECWICSFETKVPLICHNFWGYDSHPLIKVVSKFTADKLNCIPENIEKYKAMDVGQLRFLDSFQHMGMGLDKLVECLGGKLEKFTLTVRYFTEKSYSIDKIKLLFRKGVFPYDWTNAWEKFDRTSLPPRKDFYSLLSQQNISKEDYKHAQKVWKIFEMKNFGEYHDLYLETDVLLLADVFINYTIMCLKDDGLDPSHYVLAPGMFNDSLYKSSGAELKLMTDMDEYLMVENDYDSSKPTTWTLYKDKNALYSGTMTQYMPTEILGKVSPEEVPDIQSIASDAEIGYILEVNLEVPVHLHDFFADYPLAPEKQIVPEEWLSLYNERLV